MKRFLILALIMSMGISLAGHAGNYKSFKVSVYTRAYEVEKMKDLHWLDSTWTIISNQVKVDKIYLETHRDLLIVPDKTLEQAKKFFQDRGVEVGGVSPTRSTSRTASRPSPIPTPNTGRRYRK